MDHMTTYQSKLVSREEAVRVIKSGCWVDYGFCTGHPVALDQALAQRMAAEPDLRDIHFRGSIAMRRPAVLCLSDARERLTWNSWHTSAVERKLMDSGFVFYNPLRYSELPAIYRQNIRRVDVAMFQVAPMDEHGFFNFGPGVSHLGAVCDVADVIIVEVNKNMPVCLGGTETGIHISQVTFVVEGDHPPIPEMLPASPNEIDMAVAELVLPELCDGACLQLGIGGMPGAVGSLIAQSDLKDLGVHTEMYVDAFIDMAEAGKITGSKKTLDKGRQVFAFAAGTKRLYDYIDQNPAVMAAPVDYVNSISNISTQDHFMSINSAVHVDLFGQVASETAGPRHISGAGGQLDFVMGAHLSQGGKSFICMSSSVTDKSGQRKSRILPTLEPGSVVTATRANLHYLATEYGIVNLKGTSTWQRTERIISVAHPDFRDQLIKQAEQMKIWRSSNRR